MTPVSWQQGPTPGEGMRVAALIPWGTGEQASPCGFLQPKCSSSTGSRSVLGYDPKARHLHVRVPGREPQLHSKVQLPAEARPARQQLTAQGGEGIRFLPPPWESCPESLAPGPSLPGCCCRHWGSELAEARTRTRSPCLSNNWLKKNAPSFKVANGIKR